MPIPHPSFNSMASRFQEQVAQTQAAARMRSGTSEPMREKSIVPDSFGNRPQRSNGTIRLKALIPHQEQFATVYNYGLNVYWSRFDEALRDNWHNALAMRRSAFIHQLLRHRQQPTVALPWRIEVDDPKDAEQVAIADRITKLLKAIPRFQQMRLYLLENIWFGKYGSQVIWDRIMIDGREQVTVVDHEPIDGDTIVYKFDGTPGVLVRSSWVPRDSESMSIEPVAATWIQSTDRARALMLYDQNWRDHFIISEFESSSADYLFEGDKAGAVHGVGVRSRIYWDYQLYEELRTWLADALERIGVNGQLYGWYESGNPDSKAKIIEGLKALNRDNVAVFPTIDGKSVQRFEHIEPSQVGYDVLFQWIDQLKEDMKLAVLGEVLSSEARPTGMNSGNAALQADVRTQNIRYDATSQAETLTRDLLGPLIRKNDWEYQGQVLKGELPFQARFIYIIDQEDAQQFATVVKTAYDIGLPLDPEQLYEKLGLAPPKDPTHAIVKGPEMGAAPGVPGMPAPGPDQSEDMKGDQEGTHAQVNPRFKVSSGPNGKMRLRPSVAPEKPSSNGKVPPMVKEKVR